MTLESRDGATGPSENRSGENNNSAPTMTFVRGSRDQQNPLVENSARWEERSLLIHYIIYTSDGVDNTPRWRSGVHTLLINSHQPASERARPCHCFATSLRSELPPTYLPCVRARTFISDGCQNSFYLIITYHFPRRYTGRGFRRLLPPLPRSCYYGRRARKLLLRSNEKNNLREPHILSRPLRVSILEIH